jgi:hypothetical protein
MNVLLQTRSVAVSLLHKHAAKLQLNISHVVSDYNEVNLEKCYEHDFILRSSVLFEISKHRISIASYSEWSLVELTKASDTIHAKKEFHNNQTIELPGDAVIFTQ